MKKRIILQEAYKEMTGIDFYYVGNKYMYEIYKRDNGEFEIQVYPKPTSEPYKPGMITNAFVLTLKQVKEYIKDKELENEQ